MRKQVYEIHAPVKETWVYLVEAETPQIALALYRENHDSVVQSHSYSGWADGDGNTFCQIHTAETVQPPKGNKND